MNEILEKNIDIFVAEVQDKIDKMWKLRFENLTKPILEKHIGQKWVKIVRTEKNESGIKRQSVYGFIAIKDHSTKFLGDVKVGNIHSPANFDKPSKHARGSVYNRDSWNAVNEWGVIGKPIHDCNKWIQDRINCESNQQTV